MAGKQGKSPSKGKNTPKTNTPADKRLPGNGGKKPGPPKGKKKSTGKKKS